MSIKIMKAVRLNQGEFAMFYGTISTDNFIEEFSESQVNNEDEILDLVTHQIMPGEQVDVLVKLKTLPLGGSFTTFRSFK